MSLWSCHLFDLSVLMEGNLGQVNAAEMFQNKLEISKI